MCTVQRVLMEALQLEEAGPPDARAAPSAAPGAALPGGVAGVSAPASDVAVPTAGSDAAGAAAALADVPGTPARTLQFAIAEMRKVGTHPVCMPLCAYLTCMTCQHADPSEASRALVMMGGLSRPRGPSRAQPAVPGFTYPDTERQHSCETLGERGARNCELPV